jgi:hypothetical protein
MSVTALRPPLHKRAGRKAKPSRAARSVERIDRRSLIERRDQCMRDIAPLQAGTDTSGDLANKARQLLTRHWVSSSWRCRADILRTAEWLIGVGKRRAAHRGSLLDTG